MRKISKITIIIVLFSILAVMAINFFHQRVDVQLGEKEVTQLILKSSVKKNASSWGNEIRIKRLMVNNQTIDLRSLGFFEGWTYESDVLIFSGDGESIIIETDEPVSNVSLLYVLQEGSGILEIHSPDMFLHGIDMYSSEWDEAEVKFNLVSNRDRILFSVTAFLFLTFGLYFFFLKDIRLYLEGKALEPTVYKSTLGMFEPARGIGMLAIVFFHSMGLYNATVGTSFSESLFVPIPMTILNNGLMAAYFVINGYSQQKKPIRRQIKTLNKMLLIPYIYISLIVIAITSIQLEIQRVQELDIYIGNALRFFGNASAIGPLWFLPALYFGAIIINLILHIEDVRIQMIIASLIFVAGVGSLAFDWMPRILYIVGISTGYMYTGYIIKRFKIYNVITFKKKLAIFCVLLSVLFIAMTHDIIGERVPVFNMYLRETLKLVAGAALVYGALTLNQLHSIPKKWLKQIGKRSLWILLFHSIEYLTIDWRGLERISALSSISIIIAAFVVRMILILLLVNWWGKIMKYRRKTRLKKA